MENDDYDIDAYDSKRQKLEKGFVERPQSPSPMNSFIEDNICVSPTSLLNNLQNHDNSIPFIEKSHFLDIPTKMEDAKALWTKSYLSPTLGVPCPICFKVFKRRNSFICHVKKHNGAKPYACAECPKTFSQRSNLVTHLKNHTGEKLYACTYCSHRSAQKGNMKTHILRVHSKEQYVEPVKHISMTEHPNMETVFHIYLSYLKV